MINNIISGVSVAIMAAVTIAIGKHMNNSDRHPSKKDIVFNKECDLRHEGLDGKINALDEKVEIMRTDMRDNFREVKNLIRNNGRERQ